MLPTPYPPCQILPTIRKAQNPRLQRSASGQEIQVPSDPFITTLLPRPELEVRRTLQLTLNGLQNNPR